MIQIFYHKQAPRKETAFIELQSFKECHLFFLFQILHTSTASAYYLDPLQWDIPAAQGTNILML